MIISQMLAVCTVTYSKSLYIVSAPLV